MKSVDTRKQQVVKDVIASLNMQNLRFTNPELCYAIANKVNTRGNVIETVKQYVRK